MKRLPLLLGIAVLAVANGCDKSVAPPTTGSISVNLQIPPVSPSPSQATSAAAGTKGAAGRQDGGPALQEQAPAEPIGQLESVRVTVGGPTNKTQTFTCSTSQCTGTVDGLAPGSYSVAVEGLVGTEVDYFGQTTGVGVQAGANATPTISFQSFRPVLAALPDTVEVLRFTVSYSPVPGAASYVVEWSTASDFSGASTVGITETSKEIVVAQEARYYVRVRAVNSVVSTGGGWSVPRAVFAYLGVASVTVTPATPTIADGATLQFSAVARDGDTNVVSGVTFFWSSSDPNVVTINQSGLATAKGLGQATITAVGKGQPGSTSITVTFGAPAKLAFQRAPASAEPQGPMDTVEVAVLDAKGNQTDAAVAVTIALGNNSNGAVLSGTATVTSVAGVATFKDLAVDSTGVGYTLTASGTNLTSATAQVDVVLEFVQVAAGDLFGCGLTGRGNAWCWGWNGDDELGIGVDGGTRTKPTKVVGGHKWSQVSAGWVHACAIQASDSTAYCWGYEGEGRLGNGSSAGTTPTPTAVNGGLKFIWISAGNAHTCGVGTDSLAYCWGQQQNGRLGNGTDVVASVTAPTAVLGGNKFTQISAGGFHTCAVRASDGAGFCWGLQTNGRLGNNLTAVANVTSPTQVLGGHTFFQIVAGWDHTCGVRRPATDQRGMCWGYNGVGQLGVAPGDLTERLVPNFVANFYRFANISAGVGFSCGAILTGDAYCWGTATNGRLGNGDATATNYTVPSLVLGGHTFSFAMAATAGSNGWGTGCGLATDGTHCWGRNDTTGQLGDGTFITSTTPRHVLGTR